MNPLQHLDASHSATYAYIDTSPPHRCSPKVDEGVQNAGNNKDAHAATYRDNGKEQDPNEELLFGPR